MTNERHGEELGLIGRLKGLGNLRAETREELGWIEADLRAGNATAEDLRYLRSLAADRLSGAGQARSAVVAAKALRICFIGDSVTAGTGDDMFQGWAGRLCEMAWDEGHDVTGYNLGIRGETSPMIAARWRAECTPRLPDGVPAALVFAFGVQRHGRGARIRPSRRARGLGRDRARHSRGGQGLAPDSVGRPRPDLGRAPARESAAGRHL